MGSSELARIMYDGRSYPVKRAHKELAASATTEIIAAVTGKKLLIVGLNIVSGEGSATMVTLKSGTTALTGALFIYLLPYELQPFAPWLLCASGEAFNGTESNAKKAEVTVLYCEID